MELRAGYKQTEIGVFPEDWDVVDLGEKFKIKNGLNKAKEYFGYGTPIVNYMDVFNNSGIHKKDVEGKVFVNFQEKENYKIKKGDLLFTRTSETPNEIGMSSVVLEEIPEAVFSGFVLRAREKDESFNNEYKKYCFRSNEVRKQIISSCSYTTRALTNGKSLSVVKIPLPPLPEQTAIATVLSDTDKLLQAIEKKIAKKRLIKQGAMQELLRPKEGSWERVILNNVIDVNRGGSPRPIHDYITSSPDGINWIKIGDTSRISKYITGSKEKIIQEGVQNSRQVKVGDFLLSNSMSFGRPYILKIDGCIHDGWLVLQNYEENFNREFLYYTLMSKDIFNQYMAKASGSGVLNLNKELVKTVELNKPKDMVEQIRIATILSDMDNEIEILENQLAKYTQVKQGLMQNLLTGKIRLV